jgi:metal-sulfur cluster biosynthetic enzyme
MSESDEATDARRWFAQQNRGQLDEQVREALKGVIDPELGINIVDLGLVYETRISAEGRLDVIMTLTSPGCPLGPVIETEVRRALSGLFGVEEIAVTIVWTPRWTPEMMSEDARLELGYW